MPAHPASPPPAPAIRKKELVLTREKDAVRGWQTPLFAPYFHQTGFLHCVSGDAPDKAVGTLNRFRASAENHPQVRKHVAPLDGPEDIRQHCWQYNDGPLTGWHGYFNRLDGYAHSADALVGVFNAARDRGVKFCLGDGGAVSGMVYAKGADGKRKATGVRTRTGVVEAKLIIIAAGAAAARLVPECGQQVVAKAWSVAHVQLTPDEASALRGIPVTYARDLGFFFEPDPETRLLKLCPMGGGYVNTDPKTGVSHAPERPGDSNFMPLRDQKQIRRLLAQTLPELADRPLVKQYLCWFADTSDSDFIVDYVPGTGESVLLMSGDSGHGLKFFPIVGDWVRDMLAAPGGQQPVANFKWKTPSKKGGWGDDVSWRLGETVELRDLENPKGSKL